MKIFLHHLIFSVNLPVPTRQTGLPIGRQVRTCGKLTLTVMSELIYTELRSLGNAKFPVNLFAESINYNRSKMIVVTGPRSRQTDSHTLVFGG